MFSSAASGVMSMLKTSTDTGDIGGLSFNTTRLPAMPRPAHQWRQHASRLSTSSLQTDHTGHSYAASQISKRASNMQTWDTVSAISQGTHRTRGRHGAHGSLTSVQTMQTIPLSVANGKNSEAIIAGSSPYARPQFAPDGRSYSMGQPQPPYTIKPHRSATSLRSQASGPYPHQRQQYAYPTRLKRPGYRSPSPALSDLNDSYELGYGVRPGLNESAPGSVHDRHHNPVYGPSYAPSYGVQIPSIPVRRPLNSLSNNGQPLGPPHGRTIGHPGMQSYSSDQSTSIQPVSKESGSGGFPQRRPTPHTPATQMDQYSRGLRGVPIRNGPPFPMPPYGVVHQMPPRAYTPQTDSLPSSSDQGSSAPPSSNPPTPKDVATSHIMVDPAFIDPALSEVLDSHVEHNTYANYLKYYQKPDELYELEAGDPAALELDSNYATSQTGFVQRIKILLEDRAAGQKGIATNESKVSEHPGASQSHTAVSLPSVGVRTDQEPVELPTSRSVRSLSISDAAELPATRSVRTRSTSGPFELEAPLRITRNLIKASTAPSSSGPPSSEQNTITLQPTKVQPGSEMGFGQTAREPASIELRPEGRQVINIYSSIPPAIAANQDLAKTMSTSTGLLRVASMDFATHTEAISPKTLQTVLAQREISCSGLPCEDGGPTQAPVSPIQPGEDVVRDSIVSPVATQTVRVSIKDEQPSMPGSFPDEPSPTSSPSPRPRSLSLPAPSTTETISRFSLPPDLSLLNDTSVTSDITTDVAVRFSLPRTTELFRPQVVNVDTIVTSPVARSETVVRAPGNKSLRESFFNVKRVAPLQIKKTDSVAATQNGADSTDLSSFIRRSFPRRQSAWLSDRPESRRLSGESTTDLRLPTNKAPSKYLPGLKEDSQEDMSIKDLRLSGLKLGPRAFPHPKTGQVVLRHSEEAPRSSYLPARPPRMTLSELRNLPSLNFSRMNLVDRLNEALEVRSSKSIEVVRRREFSGIFCPSPTRPSSTEALRERYTSFFTKPEDFEVPELALCDSSVYEPQATEEHVEHRNPEIASQVGHSLSPSVRPLSPEELLGVASEANRLSVPSVAALTQRLSEILPSLRRLHIDSSIADDKAVKDTISEIQHLGERAGSDGFVRSSTGLRHLAAAADNIACNGTHDSAVSEAPRHGRLMKELPSLPEGTERSDDTGKFSLSESGLDKNTTLGTDALSTAIDLAAPGLLKPALLRVRSLNDIDSTDELHPGYANSGNRRSLVTLTQTSRPWNLDENYPWAANGPTIDIGFPAPVLRRNSSASTIIRRSSRTSSEMVGDDSFGASSVARRKSPLSRSFQLTSSDEATATMSNTLYGRKGSKNSLFGSLSHKMGLNKQGRSATTGSPLSQHVTSHKTGERYPSSGLFPPTALHLDEVRSFFSDSTSEVEDKRRPLRKHITSIRARMPGQSATSASRLQSFDVDRTRSLDHIQRHVSRSSRMSGLRPASLYDHRFVEMNAPMAYDGMASMGRVEFRVKRMTERLRHLWAKGGEVFRSLSQKGRHGGSRKYKQREREEWLADSLYSGD